MKRRCCRIAEWLNLQSLAWSLLMVAALAGLVYTFIPAAIRLLASYVPAVSGYVETIQGLVPLSGADAELVRGFFWSLLTLSLTFGVVVCPRRKAVVRALVDGYWTNYVSHLLEKSDLTLVVVKPTYGLCANPGLYLRETVAAIEADLGVSLEEQLIKSAGRTAFVVVRNGEALPLAFDFGRNLTVLGDMVRAELDGFLGGTVCTTDSKFEFLVDQIYRRLSQEWLQPLDLRKRVVLVARADVAGLRERLAGRV